MKPGDEVIVPANTYIATILSITENGLKPILVEPKLVIWNGKDRERGRRGPMGLFRQQLMKSGTKREEETFPRS